MVIKKCDILENINIEHQKNIYSTTTVSNTTFNILMNYQRPHVAKLINILLKNNIAIDSSDTGIGKSYISIAVAKELYRKPIIICPKTLIYSYKNILEQFGVEYYDIVNYETLKLGKSYSDKNKRIYCSYLKEKYIDDCLVYEWNVPNDAIIIFDEVHICKNIKTRNGKLLKYSKDLVDRKIPILMMSATICEKIQDMKIFFYMLGLIDDTRKFNKYVSALGKKYSERINTKCVDENGKFIWQYPEFHKTVSDFKNRDDYNKNEQENLKLLIEWYKNIYPHHNGYYDKYYYHRYFNREINSYRYVNPEFHKKIYHFKHKKEYNEHRIKLKSLLIKWEIDEYVARIKIDDIRHLFPQNQICCQQIYSEDHETITNAYYKIEKLLKKLKENPGSNYLAQIQKLKQLIEYKKIPFFIEQAKLYLKEKKSVIIFMNYRKSIKILANELDIKCIIWGGQDINLRLQYLSDFQENRTNIIICQIKAAGIAINLHDTDGNYPRVTLMNFPDSASVFLQALGRAYRMGSKSQVLQRILFTANVDYETCIMNNINRKLNNINTINDGDLYCKTYNVNRIVRKKRN